MKKQLTFSLISDELSQAKTKKKTFLEEMERIMPIDKWVEMIRPCYYKGERGNNPYDLELMVRIHLLQNFYDLSDMEAMNEIIDSRTFSDFCVVDSTLIAAPSSTKNKDKKRDPDAHSEKKGNQWYFGYKSHIGVDKDSGLVHHLEVTSANEHDVTVTSKLMHGEEKGLYGDSGYIGADKRDDAIVRNNQGKKIRYKINRKPSQIKKLSKSGQHQAKKAEHKKSSVRAKDEHVFAVVKRIFKYRKNRYRGLRKQVAKMNMMFALANLYLADRKSLSV